MNRLRMVFAGHVVTGVSEDNTSMDRDWTMLISSGLQPVQKKHRGNRFAHPCRNR